MKIIKKQSLSEKLRIVEADNNVGDGVVNLNSASEGDIKNEIIATSGGKVSETEASKEADLLSRYSEEFKELIISFGENVGKTHEGLKEELWTSLETALFQKRNNMEADYPNILIYGQAGVGKTAVVNQFCKENGINMVKIKASSLSPESIRGIPYPVKNDKTGEYIQVHVRDPKWNGLNKPCIIFCDEYNRANPKSSDFLLGLINEHVLPTTIIQDDGNIEDEVFYPNILFTVAAMNPRTRAFKDTTSPLDSAQMGRFGAVYELKADPVKWGQHMKEVFDKLLENPNLLDKDREKIEGQAKITQALVDNGITFNTQDEIDTIYLDHDRNGVVNGYLSPRTLSMLIQKCNGTKDHFLKVISSSGLRKEDATKIKNCLANYSDKDTVGNKQFDNKKNDKGKNGSLSGIKKDINSFLDNVHK